MRKAVLGLCLLGLTACGVPLKQAEPEDSTKEDSTNKNCLDWPIDVIRGKIEEDVFDVLKVEVENQTEQDIIVYQLEFKLFDPWGEPSGGEGNNIDQAQDDSGIKAGEIKTIGMSLLGHPHAASFETRLIKAKMTDGTIWENNCDDFVKTSSVAR